MMMLFFYYHYVTPCNYVYECTSIPNLGSRISIHFKCCDFSFALWMYTNNLHSFFVIFEPLDIPFIFNLVSNYCTFKIFLAFKTHSRDKIRSSPFVCWFNVWKFKISFSESLCKLFVFIESTQSDSPSGAVIFLCASTLRISHSSTIYCEVFSCWSTSKPSVKSTSESLKYLPIDFSEQVIVCYYLQHLSYV